MLNLNIILVISSCSRPQFPDCLPYIAYTISRKLPKPSHQNKDILGDLLSAQLQHLIGWNGLPLGPDPRLCDVRLR